MSEELKPLIGFDKSRNGDKDCLVLGYKKGSQTHIVLSLYGQEATDFNKAWNTRAEPKPPTADVHEIRAALYWFNNLIEDMCCANCPPQLNKCIYDMPQYKTIEAALERMGGE